MAKRFFSCCILCLSALAVLAAHRGIQTDWQHQTLSAQVSILPHKTVLKTLALDGRSVVADYLWLTAHRRLQQPEPLAPGEKSREFYLFDAITDLDPSFYLVYLYGATLLAGPQYRGDRDGGEALLKKACRAFPDRWIFPFLLGMLYYEVDSRPDQAMLYFSRALETNRPPIFLVDFIALLHRRIRGQEVTMADYRQLYDRCSDETLKQYLADLMSAADGGSP
ncbi:MAG: hypothetical protein JXO49_08845 [Deltaproteobacteria bacterium]|nr:hypothetical protein [Candidatus Anaeroferrophillus wilburensis]MBN2889436.1 hypothetical protein [Deltaproteobacteria bacterium]